MAYSWEQQIYPTGSQNVTVSIAYLDKSFIYVYLDGVLTTNYTWASDVVIRLDDALTASTEVLLVRRTDKEYLFIQFAAGAPFISDNLDTQNTQFLHLAQEMVEGRSIEGFYGDISMNGYKITNLAAGTEPGDAINKGQLDEVDTRVTQLEQTFIVPTSSYPWFTNTTTETDVLTPGFTFTKAAVYINGVAQTLGYSYEVVDNTIMLADPVPAGTHVMARLGEDVPNEQGYATTAQLSDVQSNLNGAIIAADGRISLLQDELDQDTANLAAVTTRVTTLESELSMLSTEVDQDLVALQNLTTVVDSKASKGAQGRTDLGLGTLATQNRGVAVANAVAAPTKAEFDALLTSLRNAGIIAT